MNTNKSGQNLPTRNNNPGDLKDPTNGQIRTFSSPFEGFQALKEDLTVKINGTKRLNKDSTLLQFAQVWSPDSDNQAPGLMTSLQYAQKLAKDLGVSITTTIGSLVNRLDDFAMAIAKNEGWNGPSISEVSQTPPPPAQKKKRSGIQLL